MKAFEILYLMCYRARMRRALKASRSLPVKVISVGNITVGGAGRTPFVMALAQEARARGYNPCVLTRGRGGRKRGPVVVSTGEGPLMPPGQCGDESYLMAERLEGVMVVKGTDRYEAGLLALKQLKPPPDIIIVDDGYQSWRLKRDIDVLLINGREKAPGGGRLLPIGFLKEPFKETARADVVVITKSSGAQDLDELTARIKKHNRTAPMFYSHHEPVSVSEETTDAIHPADWLLGRKLYAFCGLSDPASFMDILSALGARVLRLRTFRDHYAYRPQDLDRIVERAAKKGADWIITTEKDMVRLKSRAMRDYILPENLLTLGIRSHIPAKLFDRLLGRDN